MARFRTTKTQISGYRLLVHRIEQGFIRRDVRLLPSPFSAQSSAFVVGGVLGSLVIVVAVVLSFFSPQPTRGDAKIIATESGGRYVFWNDALHPVTNTTSARLITGSDEDVKTVKDSEIANAPRGLLMGIPGAPDDLDPRGDDTSRWAVCSQSDTSDRLELTGTQQVHTLVVAGSDTIHPGSAPLTAGESMLVTGPGNRTNKPVWLLYDGGRTEVPRGDRALQATLHITDEQLDEATVVSDALLDTVPLRPQWTVPEIFQRGAASAVMPHQRVGTVVSSSNTAGGDDMYLVLDRGLQHISPFVAQLLVNSGLTVDRDVSASAVAQAPKAGGVDFTGYPHTVPAVLSHDTVCFDWSRGGATDATTALYGLDSVPLTGENLSRVVRLLPARGETPQSDYFFTTPGNGWFARTTGNEPDSPAREQLWWVSDSGTRYAITGGNDSSSADAVSALGLGETDPHLVPWSVLRLLPEGNSLSLDAAKVVHENIPPQMASHPLPDNEGLN